MTSKQRTVIWIGLIIVALNLAVQWPTIKSIVFGTASTASTNTKKQPTQLILQWRLNKRSKATISW